MAPPALAGFGRLPAMIASKGALNTPIIRATLRDAPMKW
jgi:hypothetical protein